MTVQDASARVLCAVVIGFSILACAGSKVSSMKGPAPSEEVAAIAMAPSGGVLADAIAVELFNRGFEVVDTAQTTALLSRLNLTELEILRPESLSSLRSSGIGAVLSARSVAGYDGRPQSASVRVSSTSTGQILAGVTWQNGRGGAVGSPADSMMRSDLSEAASEVAEELAKRLRPE